MAERIRLLVQEHLGYQDQTLSAARTATKPSCSCCQRLTGEVPQVPLANRLKLQQQTQKTSMGDQTQKASERLQNSVQDQEDAKKFVDLISFVGAQKRRRNPGFLPSDDGSYICPTTSVPPRQCSAGDPVEEESRKGS